MAAPVAQYTFIPWLRQGLASKIPDADTLGGSNGTVLRRASLPIDLTLQVGSSRVDLQACKLEYSIVSPK